MVVLNQYEPFPLECEPEGAASFQFETIISNPEMSIKDNGAYLIGR
jgi:hypothetical protein